MGKYLYGIILSMVANFLKEKLPYLILFLGIFYSLSYVKCFKKGVFFTSDGGIKYFQTEQILRGDFSLDFKLKGDSLEDKIWSREFYPTTSPFIYKLKGKYYSVSPWIFSLLTAPFLKFFGFYGIHVIPFISLFGIWFLFLFFLKKENFSQIEISLFLFALIFSTPITFYGATFWEHTLSLFFLMLSIFLIYYRKSPYFASIALILAQVLRPEIMVISFFLILFIFFSDFSKKYRQKFLFTFLLLLFCQFGTNYYFFESPFGLRFLQVKDMFNVVNPSFSKFLLFRLKVGVIIYLYLLKLLFRFFPFYILMVLFLYKTKRNIKYLIFALFVPFLTSFGLPNGGGFQWGPRYLLPFILIFFITLILFCKNLKGKFRSIFLILFLGFTLLSFKLNTFMIRELFCNQICYKSESIVNFVRKNKEKVIVYLYLQTGLELAYIHGEKDFFYLNNFLRLNRLSKLLYKNGVKEFLLINETFMGKRVNIPSKFDLKNFHINTKLLQRCHYGEFYIVKLIPKTTLSNKFP